MASRVRQFMEGYRVIVLRRVEPLRERQVYKVTRGRIVGARLVVLDHRVLRHRFDDARGCLYWREFRRWWQVLLQPCGLLDVEHAVISEKWQASFRSLLAAAAAVTAVTAAAFISSLLSLKEFPDEAVNGVGLSSVLVWAKIAVRYAASASIQN